MSYSFPSVLHSIIRSKLFVPGSRPELFAKAAASECDAISFDLEDAVLPEKKPEARAAVADFIASGGAPGKVVVLRLNALRSIWFDGDLEALPETGIDVINLPKVESGEDILAAVNVLPPGAGLLATIETPKGLRLAGEIARAHAHVVGLQIGYADLLGATGMERGDSATVDFVRVSVRFASAEAGIEAYDGAYLNVQDVDGFRREAEAARRQGFAGKSCIHPSQVAIANQVFTPPAKEVETSHRIVEAAAEAEKHGRGAFLFDGKMVDRPVIERAHAVIDLARRISKDRS